jgi:hypothetical protein
MDKRLYVLAFPVAVVVTMLGVFIYSKINPVSVSEWANENDPVLAKLLELNPGMRAVPTDGDLPFYWIRSPVTANKVMIPWSEAKNAKVEISECDLSAIPASHLYPHRTETECVAIDNDKHILHALYFRTRDDERAVVDFYNLMLEPDSRILLGRIPEGWRADERREDRTHKLIFSCFLFRRADMTALVGYQEERKQPPPSDAH